MTTRRNLGPVLAIAGGALAIAAVIAGFILVGGPSDARDRRLDYMTTGRLYAVAGMVNCAFVLDGSAPPDIDAAHASIENAVRTHPGQPICGGHFTPGGHFAPESSLPSADYTRLDDSHIRLCADFRLPNSEDGASSRDIRSLDYMAFPELQAPRPAGRHCYDVELTRPPAPSQ